MPGTRKHFIIGVQYYNYEIVSVNYLQEKAAMRTERQEGTKSPQGGSRFGF